MRKAFTLIELLVVIAIIAVLAVVVVLTLNPAELLRQARDANRVSDLATVTNALNLYVTDQAGASSFSLGNSLSTGISIYDPAASSTCGSLGLPSLTTSTGQSWYCSTATSSRSVNGLGWIPVTFSNLSSGSPIGSLPVDPVNQTSTGLFYAYNTNGSQFEVTANLESQKYKSQYGSNPQTSYFPEVISGGTPTISALYNPSGLVGYWPMDEGSGSSTQDLSGSGNGGTWNGTAAGANNTYYTSGKVGSYAGYFNGTNDQVNAGANLNGITYPVSFSLWVNPSTLSQNGVVMNLGGTNVKVAIGLYSTGNAILIGAGDSLGLSGISSYLTAGRWQLWVLVYTASTTPSFYLNGMPQTLSSVSNSYTPTAGTTYIGSRNLTFFSGLIDDVRIYNRALSAAEIMALYNAEH